MRSGVQAVMAVSGIQRTPNLGAQRISGRPVARQAFAPLRFPPLRPTGRFLVTAASLIALSACASKPEIAVNEVIQ